jgi:hypothetical protein
MLTLISINSEANKPDKCELEQVLLELVSMNPKNKELSRKMIKDLIPEDFTHLFDGIQLGLQLFQDDSKDYQENIRAMMVLGDGIPEGDVGAIPSDGHIPAMRRLGELPAPIHTFGFGYNLQPGLLQSIAEFSGGNYSFIPDSSMLGTIFIHAVANLQSTFARRAVLNLTYPSLLGLEETGIYIGKRKPISIASGYTREYTIDLNTLQYGQSREYYLQYTCRPEMLTHVIVDKHPTYTVEATLQYQHGKDFYQEKALAKLLSFELTSLPESEIAYHISRAKVVAFLSNLFPIDRQGEHKPLKNDRISSCRKDLQSFIKDLPANQKEHFGNPRNRALVEDLIGDDIEDGQIELALQQQHWEVWGQHFLPSLAGAHARQMRMSFKDPGTQVYGADSPLFLKRLEVLNKAFDGLNLIQPLNLLPSYTEAIVQATEPAPVDMSRYNNPEGTCFAGRTQVMLAATGSDEKVKEEKTISIMNLRPGMTVQTLLGPRTVRTVLKCHTDPEAGRTMCILGAGEGNDLLVTEWHPVSMDSGSTWKYPGELNMAQKIDGFKEPVYAVQLQRKDDDNYADAHAINVNGLWGVTLGHGLVEPGEEAQKRDIRNHIFYGNYDAVAASLNTLPKNENNLALGAGVRKNSKTGLAEGFISYHSTHT